MTGLRTATLSVCAAALLSGTLGAGVAHAADPVKIEVDGEASAAVGLVDGEAKADANAEVHVKGSSILNNGIEIGAGVMARLDGDQPRQMFGGGRYSSLLNGGPRGIAPAESDVYLQGAYAYAKGSFGQLIVGRDQGVARMLAVKSPTIFSAVNINDWQTDLSGLNDIHTVNDFTGYATKVTYMPPANFLGGVFGGLQLGVSYSPVLRECGDLLCAPESGFIVSPEGVMLSETSKWDDAVEAALYYEKGIGVGGSDRLFVGLGASFVRATEDTRTLSTAFDDYEAYSVGLNLAYRGITLGGSVKTTNAGLASLEDDGYLAFDAGVTFRTGEESGDVAFMLGVGQSEASTIGSDPIDPTLFRDTRSAQAGVTYVLGRGITVGAAAQYVESKKPVAAGGPEEAATVVIESSIKF
ncbi:porin [Hyphococcus flavus]|uniref:Porin n=1 Tax=Hyphococcus flavus TaxID=1866326 RepID=A0AAF0CFT6_9PROT|nr:porin [Hyphococcus flavus]WDI32786.1 porin [Hyphococcus flavus]